MSGKRKQRPTKQQEQRRRKKLAARRSELPRWVGVVAGAQELIRLGRWAEAREKLEEYEHDRPGQPDVLRLLLEVYHDQHDYGPYCKICRRLAEQRPNDPHLQLMLAAGYLNDARLASSLRLFRRVAESWPDDPLVARTCPCGLNAALCTVCRSTV